MPRRKVEHREVRNVAPNVYAYRGADGTDYHFVRVHAAGKPYVERVGPSRLVAQQNGPPVDVTLQAAIHRARELRAEIHDAKLQNRPWETPEERERREQQEREHAQHAEAARAAVEEQARQIAIEQRSRLVFEAAKVRFLTCVEQLSLVEGLPVREARRRRRYYRDHKARFATLGTVFGGRHLDEITRQDVAKYVFDRTHNTGAFASWPRKVGLRPAQTEIVALSSLYGFLRDVEKVEIDNPCSRPRKTKYNPGAIDTYRPKREKVVFETDEQRDALFHAARTAPYANARFNDVEKERRRRAFAAFVKVVYYQAARPESEPAALVHADVVLPDRNKIRQYKPKGSIDTSVPMGTIRFRDTKTGVDRVVLLHPEAENALKEIMLPEPSDPNEREVWANTPIFRRRNGTAWDRNTYRDPWTDTMAVVVKDHPQLKGMVLRDLRTASNTRMGEAGVSSATRAKILGHSETQNETYTKVTDDAARQAILAL